MMILFTFFYTFMYHGFSPRASRSSSLKVVVVVVLVVVVLLLLVVVVTFCKNSWKCLRSYRGRNLVEVR